MLKSQQEVKYGYKESRRQKFEVLLISKVKKAVLDYGPDKD